MKTYEDLANVIFPNITKTIEDLEKEYPERNISGEVTRFAPSPTGFLHLGSLFTAMLCHKVAFDTNGVFYVRLEDTDTKREIEGSGKELIDQLSTFGVIPSEGYFGDHEVGKYGPYIQSHRADIYKVVIKELIKQGRAYPCFCSTEDLAKVHEEQEKNKEIPGYYVKYATCRDIPVDVAIDRINNGEPYVIRFKSNGNHLNKITFHDLIRGDISIAENDLDIVILKSDGLPTYHFAHAVDDHFMRTTTVMRGEEWISSVPIHLDLFNTLKFKLPNYAHLPVIMKLDNGNKRKLSKRKDPEASVKTFIELGYPREAVKTYLMSIANSNFEEWTLENHSYNIDEFKVSFDKMSLDGVLFDIGKLNYFSKELIALMDNKEVYKRLTEWAKDYDTYFYNLLVNDKEYALKILNIERGGEKARKDYNCYKDIYPHVSFFYKEPFEEIVKNGYPFNEAFDKNVIIDVLKDFSESFDYSLPVETWFSDIKLLCKRHNFAENGKEFKNNPGVYLGHSGDVSEMIRVALVGSKNSPNLYYVINILGKDEVTRRINLAIDYLNK